MSSRGEIVPELAEKFRAIAERMAEGTATKLDAHDLRELASQLAGTHPRFVLKVHAKRGAPAKFAERLAMARAIKSYLDEHGGTPAAARNALSGKFGVGPERLKQAWTELAPILELDEAARRLVLHFKALEARGLAKVTRVPPKKK